MKVLKYILGILLLLVLVFLLIGLIKPTVSYDCNITVNKPLAESWAVTQDPGKMEDWLDGFLRIEPVSGTPGTVGAISNVYFIQNGNEMSIQETITDIQPNESISMTYHSDFMDMDYQLSMKNSNGATEVQSTTSAKGNGMISRSIVALIKGTLLSQEELNLKNLKRTIENNTKDYFPKDGPTNETPMKLETYK